ncbi:alpha-galactosidase [Thermoactinospora rubra]|uniref:alpha-galactosidase n=1 Tax=Thermoactinospora rubra TaxID=1088767 RepID=UPI000A0FB632|nr:alpha-galactosidase [Thermoactinospora rubra]
MPVVAVQGRDHTWALHTPRTTYVLSVEQGEEARVVQWYWGPRLPDEAAAEVTRARPWRMETVFSADGDLAEALPVDGGRRWGVPSLQAVYEGGVRSVELAFASAQVRGGELDIALHDPGYGLRVTLHLRVHDDTDVIERRTTVTATKGPVELRRLDSASWLVPEQAGHAYSAVAGGWGRETQPQRGVLPVGETTFTSRTGATSHSANPWIMIGEAAERHGRLWSVALAWSGSWRLTAQRRPEGDLAVTTGFGHEGLSWRLEPGESLETPLSLGLMSDGGYGGASHAWHDYALRHVLPYPEEVRPVLYNSWEATWFDVTEEGQLDLARRAAELGVELFVVDDGWFGARTGDTRGLGDWWPNPERFPHGMGRLFDTVRELGMKAGLWVEPEMVNPDSDLYREHPDWVLHYPGRRRDTARNQLVLNFARDDVREWALGWLDGLVGDHGLEYLKWDMNRSFSQAGWAERGDWLWIGHTRGVYAVMDELRRRHPALRIESCSGGGGRVDFGVLRRTDQVWTSDNTDARDRQRIQDGFSQLYPARVMSCWVTDSPNPITGRRVPLGYRFHVAMAGVLGVGGDLREWTPQELAEAGEHIAAYKRIRRTVQHGRLDRLGGRPGLEASAVQYTLDDQVVVLAYNPFTEDRQGPWRLRLAGLDPEARYAAEDGTVWHGRTLTDHGMAVPVWAERGADYRSALIVLTRVR